MLRSLVGSEMCIRDRPRHVNGRIRSNRSGEGHPLHPDGNQPYQRGRSIMNTYRTIVTRLLANAKGRANDSNGNRGKTVPYTLTREWLEETLEKQGHQCPRTGIKYDYDEYKSWHKRSGHPARPSINRLNPSKGYTPENCEIVSNAYNTATVSYTHLTLPTICSV